MYELWFRMGKAVNSLRVSEFVHIQRKHVSRAKYVFTFISGYICALWFTPARAYDIPITSEGGYFSTIYYPVTDFFFVIVLIPAGYYLYVKYVNWRVDESYRNNGDIPANNE